MEDEDPEERERLKKFFFGPKIYLYCPTCGERGAVTTDNFACCKKSSCNGYPWNFKTGKSIG